MSELKWSPPDPPGPHDLVLIGDEVRMHKDAYLRLTAEHDSLVEQLEALREALAKIAYAPAMESIDTIRVGTGKSLRNVARAALDRSGTG